MSGAFHNVTFPIRLSQGAIGGPERRTDILALASGREIRNTRWAGSRRRWDVGTSITDLGALQELIDFFEARRGALHGFRFRDPLDHSSAPAGQPIRFDDQDLGTGDGERIDFQLTKSVGSDARPITKPVPGLVSIGIDGAAQISGWAVDELTGEVTFDAPPGPGQKLSAGFEFDCAVRFDADQIQAVTEAFGAGRLASIALVELI